VICLSTLNTSSRAEFVAALAGIFEHSPWVPERVAHARPFRSWLDMHEAMCKVVEAASNSEQLALIRAHPELAGRAAIRGDLTPESTREQQGAGLAQCTPDEYATLQALNAEYSSKFGFPFILAVKGHTRATVIGSLRQRVSNDQAHEREVALREIGRIASFRLADLVSEPAAATIMAMADQLAKFSDQSAALTCAYLTPAHRATAQRIRDWMLAAGLQVHVDAVGNVIGRLAGVSERMLITGSHYDTVIDAGKYDGRLGILLPIVVAAQLRREGRVLPYTLEVIAFAEEEGVRFKSTFLGSRAVAGRFEPAVLENVDSYATTMRSAMLAAGLNPNDISAAARNPQDILSFVEVHIEQGPVLLSENTSIGVVTSIAGSVRCMVNITGLAGHSGTVPMNLRRDAAAAAAEIVLAVERHCSGAPGLVGTVGKLSVPNGAINVIPGACELSIDIRASQDNMRDDAYHAVLRECEAIAQRRDVKIDMRKVLEIGSVPCAPQLQARLADSIRRVVGCTDARHLPSGAGHDAMMMATITEVGMLFVRSGNGGISHHPAESLTEEDADMAARVFADFINHYSL
jgi:allantoate deiminase/N-carbamoyl-L-amino-acid hydrolase